MYSLPLPLFLDKAIKFQPDICNGCHDALVISNNICGFDYFCIINRITKSETINLLQNANLTKNLGHSKSYKVIIMSKMGKEVKILVIEKLKSINFILIKILLFLNDVNADGKKRFHLATKSNKDIIGWI